MRFLRDKIFFLFLLPVFFVFHGYVQFFDLISVSTAVKLILQYTALALLLLLLCRLIFRDWIKAALFSFWFLCFIFFFGSLQDWLQLKFPGSFVNSYSFILSVAAILFIALFIYLKRKKTRPSRVILYLNILLPVLLLSDVVIHISRASRKTVYQHPIEWQTAATPLKPDIYLIIADGYTGHIPLQKFFAYDNTAFENELRNRQFYVIDSSFSNYNYTVFSLSSMLNMDYLDISHYFKGSHDLPLGFKGIRNSRLQAILTEKGYGTYNCSIFDLEGHPSAAKQTLLKFDRSPLTTQTFFYRAYRDIGYHLLERFRFLQKKTDSTVYDDLYNNLKLDSLARQAVLAKNANPKFVYTHLMMPHLPYYFDSLGNRQSVKNLTDARFHTNKKAYISYLKYSNRKLLDLIDFITTNSIRPPVIIICGDHACRECLTSAEEKKYQVMNLSAVLLPGTNYSSLYKGLSNVNLFRTVINSQFQQRIPLLVDSSILINANKSDLW